MRLLQQTSMMVGLTGMFIFSGCASKPAVLTYDQMQKTSFEQYFESQRYRAKNSEGNLYSIDIISNTTLQKNNLQSYKTTQSFIDKTDKNTKEITAFCEAQGGVYISLAQFRAEVNPFDHQSRIIDAILDKKIDEKLNTNISHRYYSVDLCTINNFPYFTYTYDDLSASFTQYSTYDHPIEYISNGTYYYPMRKVTVAKKMDAHVLKSQTKPFFTAEEVNKMKQMADSEEAEFKKQEQQYAERQQKAAIEKKKKEDQLEQTRKMLRDRIGSHTFVLYDRYNKLNSYASDNECDQACSTENMNTTGYDTIEDALNNGWQFASKISEMNKEIDSCRCKGNKYILKR